LSWEQIQNSGEIQEALMGSDIGNVSHPSLVRLLGLEVAIQVIGRNVGRLSAVITFVSFLTTLSADTFRPHQSVHPIFAALLTKVFEIQGDISVAVYTITFEPRLLY